jgi:hypothetical protein
MTHTLQELLAEQKVIWEEFERARKIYTQKRDMLRREIQSLIKSGIRQRINKFNKR